MAYDNDSRSGYGEPPTPYSVYGGSYYPNQRGGMSTAQSQPTPASAGPAAVSYYPYDNKHRAPSGTTHDKGQPSPVAVQVSPMYYGLSENSYLQKTALTPASPADVHRPPSIHPRHRITQREVCVDNTMHEHPTQELRYALPEQRDKTPEPITAVNTNDAAGPTCTASGEGLCGCEVGERGIFLITAYDEQGNRTYRNDLMFSVNMFGPTVINVRVTPHGNGTYLATYTPHMAGRFIITVQHGPDHVQGSPFLATVVSKGSAKRVSGVSKSVPRWSSVLYSKGVVQVAAGSNHSLALSDSGQVFAWGKGDEGQLGHGGDIESPDAVPANEGAPSIVHGLFSATIIEVRAGKNHTLALSDLGHIYSWGRGNEGQLGHGSLDSEWTPRRIQSAGVHDVRFAKIAAGVNVSAGLTEGGEVYIWGATNFIGSRTYSFQSTPFRIEEFKSEPVVDVDCGHRHFAAVTNMGNLYTWGSGEYGKLGHGDEKDQPFPRPVFHFGGTNRAFQVACSAFHTVVLTEFGRVFAFGWNNMGQCSGRQKFVNIPTLVHLPEDSSVFRVASSNYNMAMLTTMNDCMMTGSNSYGQLGNGEGGPLTKETSANRVHLEVKMVVDEEAQMQAADDDDLHDGDPSVSHDPQDGSVKFKGLKLKPEDCMRDVALGEQHGIILFDSSRVFTWGYGGVGSLGHNSSDNKNIPALVQSLTGMGMEIEWSKVKSLLGTTDNSVLEDMFVVLAHLADNDNYKDIIPRMLPLHMLMTFVWSRHEPVQYYALTLMSTLVDEHEANRRAVIALNALKTVPPLTKVPERRIQQTAMQFIANLVRNDFSYSEFLDANGLQYVIDELKHATLDGIQYEGLRALSNLANSNATTWSKQSFKRIIEHDLDRPDVSRETMGRMTSPSGSQLASSPTSATPSSQYNDTIHDTDMQGITARNTSTVMSDHSNTFRQVSQGSGGTRSASSANLSLPGARYGDSTSR
eukprot:GFYU01022881.1.p1 GENE.GFYU01022881.1~~GFYU01022881.1.p1  ORF type:complete len:970 (-),score=233.91 GFYU01022881.1:90-2999(-)